LSAGGVALSAGGVASGVAGVIGSVAGGLVLWVVVVSVPLSLQAATPNKARAETEARMSFFMTFSPSKYARVRAGGREENAAGPNGFRNVAFRRVTPQAALGGVAGHGIAF
jgi:hypothetical protein